MMLLVIVSFCQGVLVHVIESSDLTMVASVDVSKAGISKTFTTSNRLADGAEILMELVDGPFKKAAGRLVFYSTR